MSMRTANANGSDRVQQEVAADANAVQDAVNLVAVVGCFHRHLLALHRSGVCGDDLINHPVSLAFTSKLNSLCRITFKREMAAFNAVYRLQRGEAVEYEVVRLMKDSRRLPDNRLALQCRLNAFPISDSHPENAL